MPNESYQNTLHLIHAHIYVLDHSTVEHSCRHMPPPTLLLQIIETLEDDAFPVGEPLSDVWYIVTRVTVRQVRTCPVCLTD
jgi:hypothetical protein